jgi:large subunit ribosomal protein L15
MVTRKRKKNVRQRGRTTHGWGAKKKHRGSGNRGGVGNAGTGKRAQSKKPSIWKDDLYFGMHGFKKKGRKIKFNGVNLSDISKLSKKVSSDKIILSDFGFNKLLGAGSIDKPYEITVKYASASAVEKVKKAGGKLNLLNVSEKSDESE